MSRRRACQALLAGMRQPTQKLCEGRVKHLAGIVHGKDDLEVGNPQFMGYFQGFGEESKVESIVPIGCPTFLRLEVTTRSHVS
jgi:hypothetical protein